MKDFNCYLFDLDGTLIDSGKGLVHASNGMRKYAGLDPLPDEQILSYIGEGRVQLIADLLHDYGKEYDLDEMVKAFNEVYQEVELETPLMDKTIDILKLLQKRGKKLGIVTNKPSEFLEPILKVSGLKKYFEVVVGDDQTHPTKPDPAPVQIAMEGLKTTPEETVMIGDHHTDIVAGLNAGVTTVYLHDGIGRAHDAASDYEFQNMGEIYEVLK